jgi:2',3'-cyclic-nucleotide 2'-phosphodiesterase (5'-nucleotidase family)
MTFTLQLLHASDFEGGIDAAGTSPQTSDAVRFSAVLNRLRTNTDPNTFGVSSTILANTLTLSSGDNYIPSPFLNASSDTSLNNIGGLGSSTAPAIGRGDIGILNAFGIQASVLGNHEFDLGVRQVRDIIRTGSGNPGTRFPYLSTNLDFNPEIASSSNPDGALGATDLAANQDTAEFNTIFGKLAKSTVITLAGNDGIAGNADDQKIGIVGATTPLLPSLSSIGRVGVNPTTPTDYDALAAIIQAQVDKLTATGINKVILLAHKQQFDIEVNQLAPRLKNVDIIVAGGSHSVFADSNDPLRNGDSPAQGYPVIRNSASNEPVLVVNTGANYRYVGRLVATFNDTGIIDTNSLNNTINGAYATDQLGVDRVYGQSNFNAGGDITAFTNSGANTEHQKVVAITNGIRNVISSKDNLIVGKASVFLNGTRTDVRTRETNFGNLTADANLWQAKQVDPTVVISLKNGGGIRDNIGVISAAAGATSASDVQKLPTQPSALSPNKQVGDISQLDVENSLRFNNSLTLITVTAQQLKWLLENGVSGIAPGRTPGAFPQVAGLTFSYDATKTAIAFDNNGNVTTEGQRIRSLTVVKEDGTPLDVLVENGVLVGNPNRTFRMVTLNFLAGTAINTTTPGIGGDGYIFPKFVQDNSTLANRVDLRGETSDVNGNGQIDTPVTLSNGAFTFAAAGTEQDAFAEYMNTFYRTTAYNVNDVGFRSDFVRNISLTGISTTLNTDKTLTVSASANLRFTLSGVNSTGVNEIGVFVVDDDKNTVNGLTPGSAGYIQAALSRSKVVFSAIANNPQGFDIRQISRSLSGVNSDSRLVFYLVQNSTTDAVLAGKQANVFFSTSTTNAQVTQSTSSYEIAWKESTTASSFNNLVIKVENTEQTATLGTRSQGEQQKEIIDLRGFSGQQIQAQFTVHREAAFNNFVGFYRVIDTNGGIDINGDGTADVLPGQANYIQAAINSRVSGIGITVANQSTASFTGQFAGGGIFAPFIISNGTVEQVLSGQINQVYFPFLGANPGQVDHFRLLGDNAFGLEDLPGGGDFDYNDMIVRVNLSLVN